MEKNNSHQFQLEKNYVVEHVRGLVITGMKYESLQAPDKIIYQKRIGGTSTVIFFCLKEE